MYLEDRTVSFYVINIKLTSLKTSKKVPGFSAMEMCQVFIIWSKMFENGGIVPVWAMYRWNSTCNQKLPKVHNGHSRNENKNFKQLIKLRYFFDQLSSNTTSLIKL